MQTVAANGGMSETSSVKSGGHQGSVLGPILFMLYIANVAHIVKIHGTSTHMLTIRNYIFIPRQTKLLGLFLVSLRALMP